MYYNRTEHIEIIWQINEDGTREYPMTFVKSGSAPTFTLRVEGDGGVLGEWRFLIEVPSVYDAVKHLVINITAECGTMEESIKKLDAYFKEAFAKFLLDNGAGDEPLNTYRE